MQYKSAFPAQFVIIFAVLFNAGLSILNGQGFAISTGTVILTELVVMIIAHSVIVMRVRPSFFPWYILILVLFLIAIFRSIMDENLELKAFRDVLIIPTFIMLGSCLDKKSAVRVLIFLHIIVFAFLLMEVFMTDNFAVLFKIKEFYINTRGFAEQSFFNRDSDLFVSATRPTDRFISIFNLHRMSSVFLEPPSLGNYFIIVTILIIIFWDSIRFMTRLFLIGSNLLILIASDSRLGTVTAAFLIISAPFARYLPRYSAFIYVPLVLAGVFLTAHIFGFETGTDDFKGRIAFTVDFIEGLSFEELFGLEAREVSYDSGYGDLLITQTVVGCVILWAWLVWGVRQDTRRQIVVSHLVWIYLSLNLVVSITAMSIKTAAILWFIVGVVIAERSPLFRNSALAKNTSRFSEKPGRR